MLATVHVHTSTDLETIVVYALAAAAGAGLVWIGRKVNAIAKGHAAMSDQVLGKEDAKGNVLIPSMADRFDDVDKRFDAQDTEIADIKHEVAFNNGTSVKDCITRVETDIATLTKTVSGMDDRLTTVAGQMTQHLADTSRKGTERTRSDDDPKV